MTTPMAMLSRLRPSTRSTPYQGSTAYLDPPLPMASAAAATSGPEPSAGTSPASTPIRPMTRGPSHMAQAGSWPPSRAVRKGPVKGPRLAMAATPAVAMPATTSAAVTTSAESSTARADLRPSSLAAKPIIGGMPAMDTAPSAAAMAVSGMIRARPLKRSSSRVPIS